jgi:hypothetical protein
MPIFAGNPNAFPPWPPPQYGQFPGGNWLMQNWGNAVQRTPWAVPEGFQPVPHQYPQIPGGGGMLAQPVADIYSFTKKGLLGTPGTEGAGGRGLGSRAQGGLLGSKWRDPRFIENYETQQGLKPGSLQRPTASVRQIPSQADAAVKKAEAAHQAEIAKRIAARQKAQTQYARQSPEEARSVMSQREKDAAWEAAFRRGLDPATGKPVRPTPAQMARPVRQTPEISAKLQQARDARAASEGYRLVEDARAWMSANKGKKPFDSKVIADRYNKMDVNQQEIFSRIMFKDDPWDPYR